MQEPSPWHEEEGGVLGVWGEELMVLLITELVVVILILLVSTLVCCRANIPFDSTSKIYMRPFSCQHHESFSVFFISTPLVVLLSAPAFFRP